MLPFLPPACLPFASAVVPPAAVPARRLTACTSSVPPASVPPAVPPAFPHLSAVLIQNRITGQQGVCKQVFVGRAIAGSSASKVVISLEREVKALASLTHHPNVIRYRTCFLRGDCFCIIMEYAAGGTLMHAINRRKQAAAAGAAGRGSQTLQVQGGSQTLRVQGGVQPFPADTIIRWAAQLCSALHAIHSEHVLHRDLKPSNVFLSSRLDVKLGDFGLSRQVPTAASVDELVRTTCGTPYYMSPEQVHGLPYSYEADVWAYGCVLFEMLTMQRPFVAKSFPQLASIIVDNAEIDPRHDALLDECSAHSPPVPDGLLALPKRHKLFQTDPKQRTTLKEVAEELYPLIDERGLRRTLLGDILSNPPSEESSGGSRSSGDTVPSSSRQRTTGENAASDTEVQTFLRQRNPGPPSEPTAVKS